LTYNNYWRLVALASVDFCFTIPLATLVIVLNTRFGIRPWVSWDDTHWGYSRVFQFPSVVLDHILILIVVSEIRRWGTIFCAFLLFGFFGFTDEAMKNYRLLASIVAKRLGCKRVPPNLPPDQPPAVKFPTDEVPQIPEYAIEAPESVYPDNAPDQV
jgi:pheromone a factor receptor